jgi:uncharacterized membrane protein YbhN (UPF0104 family)
MNRKRAARVAFQAVAIGAIFAFLGHTLLLHWRELAARPFTLRPGPFALATALLAAGYLGWFLLWHLLTLRLRVALSLPRAFTAYFYSLLGKYLPGKVWMLAGRFYFYRREGKDAAILSVAVVVEGFYHVAGQAALVLALAPLAGVELPRAARLTAPVVLVLGLVALHPRLLEAVLNLALRLVRRAPVRVTLTYGDLLGLLVLYMVQYAVLGLAFFFLADALHPLPLARAPDLVIVAATGGLVSMLALFAPAGLGVREGVFYLALRGIVPDGVAVVLALLTRVWTTAAEVVLVGIALLAAGRTGAGGIIRGQSDEAFPRGTGTR